MYEEDGTGISRLKRVQDAALAALPKLKPDDTLCIVAFAHDAAVVLPPTLPHRKGEDREDHPHHRPVRRRSGRHGHGRGHELGLEQLREVETRPRHAVAGGRADRRRDLRRAGLPPARPAGGRRRRSTSPSWASAPSGTRPSSRTWPSSARASGTTSTSTRPSETAARLRRGVRAPGRDRRSLNVEMHLRPMKDIKIKRVRQVVPEIKELPLTEPEERHLVASLGTLEQRQVDPLHPRPEPAEAARRQVSSSPSSR